MIDPRKFNKFQAEITMKQNTPRHIVLRLLKANDAEKILYATSGWGRGGRHYIHKNKINNVPNFSSGPVKARKHWEDIFKFLKEK